MRPSASPSATTTAGAASTTTVTVVNSQPQTLTLRLKRKEKKVTWKEGTVDNEFMQKKSSKKCCIFHKEKSFDEDCSDDEDDHNHDHDHDHKSDGACSSKNNCGGDLN
ncbi:Type 1 phosphatases regulator ypi1 [Euphorbia peplus]|nr:Type 1 phosphatases regulator ypi1 [Euphorbia peplus]